MHNNNNSGVTENPTEVHQQSNIPILHLEPNP